jgi:hypothetical protein
MRPTTYKLLLVGFVLTLMGCHNREVHNDNLLPQTEIVSKKAIPGVSALLAVQNSNKARNRYEETYYCYVDEPFTLDLNEPGEEQGTICYEGLTTLFDVDSKTGSIEFTPTDFLVGKWKPLIHVKNTDGRVLYWIHLDFEVLERSR